MGRAHKKMGRADPAPTELMAHRGVTMAIVRKPPRNNGRIACLPYSSSLALRKSPSVTDISSVGTCGGRSL
jgi:hypothetical protein